MLEEIEKNSHKDKIPPQLKGKGVDHFKEKEKTTLIKIRGKVVDSFREQQKQSNNQVLEGKTSENLKDKNISIKKTDEGFIYEVRDIGFIDFYTLDIGLVSGENKKYLQVNIIEINENQLHKGYGLSLYKYVLENLPLGYNGIASGTITNDFINDIYDKLSKDYKVEKKGIYFVEPIKK